MSEIRKPELLAPAGDMECIETAIKYGADAIYCGGPFMQLRASKVAFDREMLPKAVEYVHSHGAKLYTTVNCFARNDEINILGDYAKWLKDIGVDAAIVSDIGAVAAIKEGCPDLEVHISTQANCMNYKAAQVYYNMGAKRIVLAREHTIESIAELHDRIPKDLELEAFVHGAMCMSYSGRCLLSAYLTGRSGNRGECAQSCRWNYYLMEEKRPGEYFKLEESDEGTAILSSKELCCLGILDKLTNAGVISFKVEGRMRTPFYIGTVINAYRMAIDGYKDTALLRRELDTTSHRVFCEGFYMGNPGDVAPDSSGYVRDWLFIATAKEYTGDGKLIIETRNPFSVGDEVEVLTPGMTGRKFTINEIVNEDGESLNRSNTPMRIMTINAPGGIQYGDIIRKNESSV